MTERYDLVVVGAGPGGSATAYYASKAGLNTVVLDRQEFPRDKVCGDGLMPHAASEISLLGLGKWLDEPHHGKFTGFSIYSQTAYLRQKVPPSLNGPHGYVVKREETDARLLERAISAGAEFNGATRATEILRSPAGKVTGVAATNGEDLRFEAPLVVAADGVGGFASSGMKTHQNAVARRRYYRGVDGPNREDLHIFISKDMNEHGAGYGWVFYLGDGRANVGAGVSTKVLARTGRNLKDFFDRFLEEPQMAEWLESAEPEGPVAQDGDVGRQAVHAGAHDGRGRGEHGPPDQRRGRRVRHRVRPAGRILGVRGAREGRLLRLYSFRLRAPAQAPARPRALLRPRPRQPGPEPRDTGAALQGLREGPGRPPLPRRGLHR